MGTTPDDPARSLGLPFDGMKTPQDKGRASERDMARNRGAHLHPMSGAGRIKDDASNDEAVFEFKNVFKSHSLRGTDLLALFVRAVRQGKQPIYVVYFEDVAITAEIRLTKGNRR